MAVSLTEISLLTIYYIARHSSKHLLKLGLAQERMSSQDLFSEQGSMFWKQRAAKEEFDSGVTRRQINATASYPTAVRGTAFLSVSMLRLIDKWRRLTSM